MGLIPGTDPTPIPGTIPQGNGMEGIGMEKRVACDSIHLQTARARLGAWMAADAAEDRR
jgi:hypothetical protein